MSSTRDDDHALMLPTPPLTHAAGVSENGEANNATLAALPARPGVLVIEDESGHTLSILQSADLRRAARVRLGAQNPEERRSKRIDLRPVARRVLACTVGSAFESDWAILQLARMRLPHSYKSMLDRWQAWYVHCDSSEEFPQWVKTVHPLERRGVYVGPISDKHTAAKFREMLEDAFDLCRYHHILVQSPNGKACAYKEMGRCPAPCDGSVAIESYRAAVQTSVDFARDPQQTRHSWEADMHAASATMDFETAARCKTLLDRTDISRRREFAHVRDLREFRFIALAPGERRGTLRVFAIAGGWIAPIVDIMHGDVELTDIASIMAAATALAPHTLESGEAHIENMSVVCRHLFAPRARSRNRRVEFLRWNERSPAPAMVRTAITRLFRDQIQAQETDSDFTVELELEIDKSVSP